MSWDDAIDGVDRETPGGRMPRAWQTARRLRLPAANDDPAHDDALPAYAELHCLSDFSFLRGAASAEALFARAQACGYEALAITDECSLAGIVRAYVALRDLPDQLDEHEKVLPEAPPSPGTNPCSRTRRTMP